MVDLKLPLYFLSTKHFLSQVFWEFWRMRLPGPLSMGPGSRLSPDKNSKYYVYIYYLLLKNIHPEQKGPSPPHLYVSHSLSMIRQGASVL